MSTTILVPILLLVFSPIWAAVALVPCGIAFLGLSAAMALRKLRTDGFHPFFNQKRLR